VGACFGSEEVFSQTAGIQTVYIGTKKREKSTQLKQDNEELFQNKTDFFGNSTFFAVHDKIVRRFQFFFDNNRRYRGDSKVLMRERVRVCVLVRVCVRVSVRVCVRVSVRVCVSVYVLMRMCVRV